MLSYTRRSLLKTVAAAPLMGALARAATAEAPPKSKMGIATTSYMSFAKPKDTLEFLEHCHLLGAAGIQAGLSSQEPEYLNKLRARCEGLGMYLEVMVELPRGEKRIRDGGFERDVKAAKLAGASCLRSECLGGRRYETFSDLRLWQTFITDSLDALRRAVPILEHEKIPLGLENHKDWTVQELKSILANIASEYLGACIDFGNNISLLDEPTAVLDLAPFAVCTHVKDMGLEPYDQGFLLSEMPMGEGFVPMQRIIETIRNARPKTNFTLEMITRNPLQVPCLTRNYWVTFPDRPGFLLARTLDMVRVESKRREKLPRVDSLTPEVQLRLEEENVKTCLHYGREQLGL